MCMIPKSAIPTTASPPAPPLKIFPLIGPVRSAAWINPASQRNNFYGITSNGIANASVISSFVTGEGYVAQLSNNEYVSGNASSLGTCDSTNGLIVDVYIWLEGTDAQAIQGQSSNDKGTLTITINYVGIEN